MAASSTPKPRRMRLWLVVFSLSLVLLCLSIAMITQLYGSGFYTDRADRLLWSICLSVAALLLPCAITYVWLVLAEKNAEHEPALAGRSSSMPLPAQRSSLALIRQNMQNLYPGNWRHIKAWGAVLSSKPEHDDDLVVARPGWEETDHALFVSLQPDFPEQELRSLRGRWRQPLDALVMLCGKTLPTVGDEALHRLLDFNARSGWRFPISFALTGWTVPAAGISCPLSNPADMEQTRSELRNFSGQMAIAGQTEYLAHQTSTKLVFSAELDQPGRIDALATRLSELNRHLPAGQNVMRLGWVAGEEPGQMADHLIQGWTQYAPRRHRLSAADIIGWILVALALLVSLASITSFVRNRALLTAAQTSMQQLGAAHSAAKALPALLATQQVLQHLSLQEQYGIPLLSRFGLNQNHVAQKALFAAYGAAARRWIITPAQQNLQRVLIELNNVPLSGGGDAVTLASRSGFDGLKAYLMLDTPARTQAPFLSARLMQASGADDPARTAVFRFFASNLAAHPDWRLVAEPAVVSGARQTLLSLNGVEHGDEAIYHTIMQQAGEKYPARTVSSLLPGVDSRGLFQLPGSIAGAYTREAWEGYVDEAINAADPKQGGEALWVMGAEARQGDTSVLKTRLRQRYFADYATAWQSWLNGLRWQPASALSGAVEQLNTYADPQRSPLQALMSMIQYQGQAGAAEKSLANDLLDKTRALVGKSAKKVPLPSGTLPTDPLARAFGPLLALAVPDEGKGSNQAVSLARYLEAVTSVRLKLQQLAASPNPDAAARQLAQALFKGQQNELADGQKYAALLAASLGAEWSGFAQQLFVSPLDSANTVVMLPAASDINDLWRRSILLPWGSEMAGRFPFNATDNDSSLPVVTRFLAPEQGNIARFLGNTLAGALVQEGDQWLPSPTLQNAAPFDADFLNGVNTLGHLASLLYAQGEAGYQFELRPVAMPGLMETDLSIDGQELKYFNQREAWSPMHWPGNGQKTGTRLLWQSLKTGTRQTLAFNGRWAFIRLLEKAKVEQLDKARYQLDFSLPDGLTARYILRTTAGDGPLALLKLREFKLPARVFALPASGDGLRQAANKPG